MSYVKIYVHAVWATKNRRPYLKKDIRAKLIEHIRKNSKNKNIFIDHINGGEEHLHCLISMNSGQNMATIAELLKGESSYWMNKQKLIREKFAWQNEYFAVSIGESQLNAVRAYIRNQEAHHRKKTFKEEYNEFMKHYQFEKKG